MRQDGVTVSGECIKAQARSLFSEEYPDKTSDKFNASNGCLDRFIKRHKLACRTVTTQGKKIPDDAKTLANHFLTFVAQKMTEQGITLSKHVANIDETLLWFDLPNSKSYDFRDIKTVKAKTTGHEKLRYTAVLSAMANGTKLKPMIIFKNLKHVPEGVISKDVLITVAKGGSMTTGLMNTLKRDI
jgi:hypothetical protein